METILIWLIIMIVLLLISLKFSEWMIICGIVWILAGLQEIIKIDNALGLIVISIGMFIMLYGILELIKR